MGLLSNIGRKLIAMGGEPTPATHTTIFKPARQLSPSALRAFNAATPDRTNQTWSTVNESSNRELRYNLRSLRARSRDLANNNEYGAKFLDMCTQNIVGPDGVLMIPAGKLARGKLDTSNNAAIADAWTEWSRRGISTIDGQLSWVDAQRVIVECVARDGDVLIKHIVGPAARNEFGYAIQILEADYLDDLFSLANDPSGAGVFMGVETDASTRVTAYWMTAYNPADYGYSGAAARKRIAAEDMLHCFVPRRGGQRRGVPWMSASMSALFQLGEFKDSELIATRAAAGKMGFYTQNGEGAAPMGSDDEDADGNPIQEVEPGMLEKLPFGWDIKTVDWAHPNVQFDQFVKSCLRGSAAGMGVGYNTLASDLENVNYSSLREGRLEMTDLWRNRQRWFSEWVTQPVYSKWLDMAILSGKVSIPQGRAEAFRYPTWQGRGWSWVDPQKEADANRTALALGLRTRTDILSEQGKDFVEIITQLASEAEQMIALGLNPDVPLPGKGAAPGVEAEDAPGVTAEDDAPAPAAAAAPAAKAKPATAAKSIADLSARIDSFETMIESKFDSRLDKILSRVESLARIPKE